MRNFFLFIIITFQAIAFAQTKKIYNKAGKEIDASLIDENVGDNAKKVNTVFLFKNGTRSHFIKIMNLEGKTYAQGISEYVVMDFNSKKGGDLHRKVEKLTNIVVEDGKLISDQLKISYVYLKEKGANYDKEQPPINIMVCTPNKNNTVSTCRLNDSQEDIIPEEIPGKYPQTSITRIGVEDLKNKKPKELNIMKKEIYARYGYKFSDKSDQDYFFAQNWYEPVVDNNLIQLNELEEDNVNMISLYENSNEYKNLNIPSYSHIIPIETTSTTLFDKTYLKSIKNIKQDTLGNGKCEFTEFNRNGISTFKHDCMINKSIYENLFYNNFLVQNIDQNYDTYFYYNKNGLPIKTVKLNYEKGTTDESYYHYDINQNINKKVIYQNNYYNSTIYYNYDYNNNMVKEYYKDDDGNEVQPIEYFYDEDNINTGNLTNNELQCDYTFNEAKDIITEIVCYKHKGEEKDIKSKNERKVLETKRGKHKRISFLKLSEQEGAKYGISIIELKYY